MVLKLSKLPKQVRFLIIIQQFSKLSYNVSVKQKVEHFLRSPVGAFVIGALIGFIFFTSFYGLTIVNPGYTDWIFQPITHDTAQHFIGWEFFRADSTGGMINGLAYPEGLPVTFMDAIPLLAFPFKWLSAWLPANFQYFGLWALGCYVSMGGVAAVLTRKVWLALFAKKSDQKSLWQLLFVAAGSLIFVVTPMLIARSLYHPALAAHWLILAGILLVWDAVKFKKAWSFVLAWSGLLMTAVLVHPYFVPMLGAMLVVAVVRMMPNFQWRSWLFAVIKIILPVAAMGLVFWSIGGFGLGSGAEIRDLSEKGFNLLSFANPSGFSALIPGFPNASTSPETLMWLGLGVWLMIIFVVVRLRGHYKNLWRRSIDRFQKHKLRNSLIAVVCLGLLIFAIGVSVDLGPITLFTYSVPQKIYEIWSAFRAAAREAWAFYYVVILLVIYASSKVLLRYKTATPVLIASCLALVSFIQLSDIWFSEKATTRREGFAEIQQVDGPAFVAPEISDLVTTQRHLVMLDQGFRGDQSGTYKIAQAALANNLTLNIGFFARIPEPIWQQQADWRDKVKALTLTESDLEDNLFATADSGLASEIATTYRVERRGGFYFILQR